MKKVLQLSLTYNRNTLLQRGLYSFLQQDYSGPSCMLIFNTGNRLELGDFEIPKNKEIILINSQKKYNSIGDKYLDSMNYWPDFDIINFLDSDDFHLPHGMRTGAENLIKSGYKTKKSYFHHNHNISQEENTFEGSIFLSKDFILKHKFLPDCSVKYHDGWVTKFQGDITLDEESQPYFVYDWSNEVPTYKISGKADTPENFHASEVLSQDNKETILTPQPHNYQEIINKCQTSYMDGYLPKMG